MIIYKETGVIQLNPAMARIHGHYQKLGKAKKENYYPES
jgi:hypothetical protein